MAAGGYGTHSSTYIKKNPTPFGAGEKHKEMKTLTVDICFKVTKNLPNEVYRADVILVNVNIVGGIGDKLLNVLHILGAILETVEIVEGIVVVVLVVPC